jgi:hypothetical protein
MRKISTKIISLLLLIALSACARTPNVIDAEKLNASIQKDLLSLTVDAPQENIDAVHVIGHGSVGQIAFGTAVLNSDTLETYENILKQIGTSLSENGDIFICFESIAV